MTLNPVSGCPVNGPPVLICLDLRPFRAGRVVTRSGGRGRRFPEAPSRAHLCGGVEDGLSEAAPREYAHQWLCAPAALSLASLPRVRSQPDGAGFLPQRHRSRRPLAWLGGVYASLNGLIWYY